MNKCSPQQMLKVIARNAEAPVHLPETRLILAIFGTAISDLLDPDHRRSARRFFANGLFHIYCDLIGLNPSTTRQLLVTGGFLRV
jgi:hypothetical protein